MRLLYVVQRYGLEVSGGAELHCRQFATRLRERGHDVEVVTSCALSYQTWANWYPAGTTDIDGVPVHRLETAAERDVARFGPFTARLAWRPGRMPLYVQCHWLESQGPFVPEVGPWLAERAGDYDVVIFFTYLYFPTWAGLPVATAAAPTILHPTAHDEPPFWFPLYDTTFRHPSAFAFSTEEEADLVRRRGGRGPGAVIGVGIERPEVVAPPGAFREKAGIGDRPYLLFLGRLEPAKGSEELPAFFAAYKRRNPGPLALVMVGEPLRPLPPHPDMFVTGYLDDELKVAALGDALALVQPSYAESFSMVLAEAWSLGVPALVQGRCPVLAGQARRAGGGLPYCGFAEFEAAVDLLCARPALRAALGRSGARHVEERYTWDAVLGRYEALMAGVIRPRP